MFSGVCRPFILSFAGFCLVCSQNLPVSAAEIPHLSTESRLKLARDFVSRMKDGYGRVNLRIKENLTEAQRLDLRGLPDGERLIFELGLPDQITIEESVSGQIHKRAYPAIFQRVHAGFELSDSL